MSRVQRVTRNIVERISVQVRSPGGRAGRFRRPRSSSRTRLPPWLHGLALLHDLAELPCSHGVEDPEACPHDLALGEPVERVGELVAALLAGEAG